MIELTMEIQKLEEKHAEDMCMLLMEKHAEIQKLHMDQNEHLENEMEKLKKILSNFQKLKDENDNLKAENEDLKQEIAELKPAAGSAAGGQW